MAEPPSPPAVDPARLEAHVRALCERFSPRDYLHPENLDRAAAYLRAELEAAGGRVSEQPYEVGGLRYRNVIAVFGPEQGERLVVGAHYDTAGEQVGADDNASGVAGLLELAVLLGKSPPKRRVDLVAYSLEEPPFFRSEHMGSAVHARSLKEAGVPVRAMISLEMIGYFRDEPKSQRFPVSLLRLFYPSEGNFIAVISKLGQGRLARQVKRAMRGASELPVYSLSGPRFVQGIDFSDHLSYWEQGYDAAMITDTAFLRNANYHTEGDTPDTLDYQRMAKVVLGAYAALTVLSE